MLWGCVAEAGCHLSVFNVYPMHALMFVVGYHPLFLCSTFSSLSARHQMPRAPKLHLLHDQPRLDDTVTYTDGSASLGRGRAPLIQRREARARKYL